MRLGSIYDSRFAKNSISSEKAVSNSVRCLSLSSGLFAFFALNPGRRNGSKIALRRLWDGRRIFTILTRILGGWRRNLAHPAAFISPPSLYRGNFFPSGKIGSSSHSRMLFMVAKESFLIDDSGTILIWFASAPPNASIQSNVGFFRRGNARKLQVCGSSGFAW